MDEFKKSQRLVKKVLRVQFIGGAVLIAGVAVYHGVVTGAWSGAVMFAGGGVVVLSVLVWLMRMKAEERLKKVMAEEE
jgi:O-antigen/teichoic acid export membrane protein